MQIVYPSTLPAPAEAPLTPEERRIVSALDGARLTRVHQRDFLGTMSVRFFYTFAEAAIFDAWWRTTLTFGGAWFAAPTWPTPKGGIGVFQFLTQPQRALVPAVGWEYSALVAVRGASLIPAVNLVVSYFDFIDSFGPPVVTGSAPAMGSVAVTGEDRRGVNWTLWAYYTALPTIGGGSLGHGSLVLPPLVFSGGGFSFSALTSETLPSLVAPGDFTMELLHTAGADPSGNYSGTSPVMMLSGGIPAAHWTGPQARGEWALIETNTTLAFSVCISPGTFATAIASPYTYPFGGTNEIAITRASGILRLFVNGTLIATQASAADSTPLLGQVTIGGTDTGKGQIDAGSNNAGYGTFYRWRYTNGEARYVANYTPLPAGLPYYPI